MFERFTPNARRVVLQAHEVARRTDADEVLPAHLFAALVEATGSSRCTSWRTSARPVPPFARSSATSPDSTRRA
jgi:hypothetical protein